MELTLQDEEAKLLKEILERYLSNLRMEIAGTEKFELREALKADEESLKQIISRLAEGGA